MTLTDEKLFEIEKSVCSFLYTLKDIFREEWIKPNSVSYKVFYEPHITFESDIEDKIRVKLHTIFPEAGFIVEEGTSLQAKQYNWVIDPIDQTKNFIGQMPLFYTQVALLDQGKPICGVIYNPISDQMFSASFHNGSRLNGDVIVVHSAPSIEHSIIDFGVGGITDIGWKFEIIERMAKRVNRVRITSSAYAPYILTGAIHAFVELNERVKIVDMMPRMICFTEAGFRSEKITIHDHTIYLSAYKTIFDEIEKKL